MEHPHCQEVILGGEVIFVVHTMYIDKNIVK
nr:MAG TPA: hypothetical protein [Caudoviricetes sp.]